MKEASRDHRWVSKRRHLLRNIIFGKVALIVDSKSSEMRPHRLAHIAATLSQGRLERLATMTDDEVRAVEALLQGQEPPPAPNVSICAATVASPNLQPSC